MYVRSVHHNRDGRTAPSFSLKHDGIFVGDERKLHPEIASDFAGPIGPRKMRPEPFTYQPSQTNIPQPIHHMFFVSPSPFVTKIIINTEAADFHTHGGSCQGRKGEEAFFFSMSCAYCADLSHHHSLHKWKEPASIYQAWKERRECEIFSPTKAAE